MGSLPLSSGNKSLHAFEHVSESGFVSRSTMISVRFTVVRAEGILIALINFVLVISVNNVVPVDSKYGSNPGTSAQVV